MMTPRAEKALTEWRAVNSRLLLAKFRSIQCNMSIIVCYAPTNDSPEERNDEYYEELQSVIGEIPERDMKIVIGDFNGKTGRNNEGIENVMGVEGLAEVANKKGADFISFCSTNNLVIGSTLFQLKYIHKSIFKFANKQRANKQDDLDDVTLKNRFSTRRAGVVGDGVGGYRLGLMTCPSHTCDLQHH
ncbi:craniofacial development protein 2-like [Palaemon carinicauda]|uniref:craniofacial development protein 2-like n=1 Tax=Palaemon carinicauda TaxID=392227 RepID=UPI0035B64D4C